jgi:membrane protein YdbS with pleckstrin-like domain
MISFVAEHDAEAHEIEAPLPAEPSAQAENPGTHVSRWGWVLRSVASLVAVFAISGGYTWFHDHDHPWLAKVVALFFVGAVATTFISLVGLFAPRTATRWYRKWFG